MQKLVSSKWVDLIIYSCWQLWWTKTADFICDFLKNWSSIYSAGLLKNTSKAQCKWKQRNYYQVHTGLGFTMTNRSWMKAWTWRSRYLIDIEELNSESIDKWEQRIIRCPLLALDLKWTSGVEWKLELRHVGDEKIAVDFKQQESRYRFKAKLS